MAIPTAIQSLLSQAQREAFEYNSDGTELCVMRGLNDIELLLDNVRRSAPQVTHSRHFNDGVKGATLEHIRQLQEDLEELAHTLQGEARD